MRFFCKINLTLTEPARAGFPHNHLTGHLLKRNEFSHDDLRAFRIIGVCNPSQTYFRGARYNVGTHTQAEKRF